MRAPFSFSLFSKPVFFFPFGQGLHSLGGLGPLALLQKKIQSHLAASWSPLSNVIAFISSLYSSLHQPSIQLQLALWICRDFSTCRVLRAQNYIEQMSENFKVCVLALAR